MRNRQINLLDSQIRRVKAQINQLDDDSLFTEEDKKILLPKYNEELEKMKQRRKIEGARKIF